MNSIEKPMRIEVDEMKALVFMCFERRSLLIQTTAFAMFRGGDKLYFSRRLSCALRLWLFCGLWGQEVERDSKREDHEDGQNGKVDTEYHSRPIKQDN